MKTSIPRYASGDEVHIGDRVSNSGVNGTVMFVVEQDEWTVEFPSSEWGYLNHGFMVKEDDGTLIHYDEADDCMELLGRGR